MDVIVGIAKFIVNNVLNQPAYLVGIITAIGLLALRRSVGQVIGGGLKAAMGFLILGVGASTVVGSLEPLGKLILGATGARGVVPTNEAVVALAQKQFGAQVAWVMIAGFIVSILLARFTPLKYVFLTGHHTFFMATLITALLATADLSAFWMIAVGAALLGTMMVVMPTFTHPWTRRVTGGEDVAIGHFGSIGYITAGTVGRLVGKRSKSTEDMKFPDGLKFLRDSMIATALSMVLIYTVFALAMLGRVGRTEAFAVMEATTLGDYVMAGVMQALLFGVGVAVILFGVRTILGELVPAFNGIAAKVVPGALPALDCPVTFPYAPNAVLIGFISSFTGGLASLGFLMAFNGPMGLALILPGMVPHFFTGGTAGVFGNATGGRRGAIAGGFVNGVIITFLPALLLKVLGSLGLANTTFGDADFGWFGLSVGHAVTLGPAGGMLVIALIVLVLLGSAIAFQRLVVSRGWNPGAPRDTYFAGAGDEDADPKSVAVGS
ncbi:PTS ascorbate transporter subunit IIC [Streptomyces roseicoloratus]|uniref:PTS ascorbate transporter subunit IIC n=1 Tax=Streptomyces roseicoloratus TaxID=2508722 RepID=UPI001009E24A|nr:PTS ascorbate transporter subunit IIC [Streptomyces roseicoloratus]